MSAKFLTPDTPDSGFIWRKIPIPNDISFIGLLNRAIADLLLEYNWQEQGSMSVADTIEYFDNAWKEMILTSDLGKIFPYITPSPPPNCLPCNGSTFERVDYPQFYAEVPLLNINADQFITPTLDGRVIFAPSASLPLYSNGGALTHTLTTAEMPAHTHSESAVGSTLGVVGEIPALVPTGSTGSTGSAGSGTPFSIMPPYVVLNYAVVARG